MSARRTAELTEQTAHKSLSSLERTWVHGAETGDVPLMQATQGHMQVLRSTAGTQTPPTAAERGSRVPGSTVVHMYGPRDHPVPVVTRWVSVPGTVFTPSRAWPAVHKRGGRRRKASKAPRRARKRVRKAAPKRKRKA